LISDPITLYILEAVALTFERSPVALRSTLGRQDASIGLDEPVDLLACCPTGLRWKPAAILSITASAPDVKQALVRTALPISHHFIYNCHLFGFFS